MIKAKSSGTVIGTSLFSAIAASLCCITPVIAMLAGSSSIAANFSWLEPARPYLIGLSVIALALAWYQQLKPVKTSPVDCHCETTKSSSFIQSKGFLGAITFFAILMITFPLYAKVFYPQPKGQAIAVAVGENKQQAKFNIQGITCKGCEDHVNNELSKVIGIITYSTSYAAKSSLVTFDPSKVDIKAITAAITKTGYKVKNYELMDATNATVPGVELHVAGQSCEKGRSCDKGGKSCCEKN